MKTSKGFTIIELLVVIAIIAVLAAVVMVNVTSYVGKAKDGAVKADLAQIQTTAAVVYDDNTPDSYLGLCTNADVVKAKTAAETAAGTTGYCGVTATTGVAWAICVPLKYDSANAWCIDSTSAAKTIAATACVPTATFTACP